MTRTAKRWLRKGLMPLLVPAVKWYLTRSRTFNYEGIHLQIPTGVFHPGLFFSTKFLIRYLKKQTIQGQQLLELGAGSGLISLFCCQQGAIVTASDINKVALENLKQNSKDNNCSPQIVHSDLFDALPQHFDWIIINPPYYPRAPKNEAERAWFCGAEFEYFHKLATQLPNHIHQNSTVLMVLSEDCDLDKIRSILGENGFQMELVAQKEFWLEQNYIFNIKENR